MHITIQHEGVTYAGDLSPLPPAEPDTSQKIRDAIGQLRSQNVPWPDVGMHLQTWTLQRGLTPQEWEVAYAAGFPRPDPAPSPAPSDPDWNANMGYKSGQINCPGWWGGTGGFIRALNHCDITWQGLPPGARYSLTVNQGEAPQAPSVTVTSMAGTVTRELSASSQQSCGVVEANEFGTIAATLEQTGGCVVQLVKAP